MPKDNISYSDYLSENSNAMSVEEADQIYRLLYSQIDPHDEDLVEFFDNVVTRASEYAEMRFKWSMMSFQERVVEDEFRTSKHNAFLNSLSMMRTVLQKKGKTTEWFDMMGEDIQKTNRKRAGDFACYIVLFRSLGTR